MTTLITANVSKDVLTADTAFSDRFVYSNYFVPLLVGFDSSDIPMLPFYTKKQVLQLMLAGVYDEDVLKGSLDDLGLKQLWAKNDMQGALDRLRGGAADERRRWNREVKEVASRNKAIRKAASTGARPAAARRS